MGSTRVAVYNPDEVIVIFAGQPLNEVGGYADGEFCTVDQESDDSTDVAGTDGEVAVSRTNDKRATVTIKLLQTSYGNDLLNIARTAFVTAPAGLGGIHPLLIQDPNGTALFTAQNAWISRPPTISYDREATSREWTIRCANLVRKDGGNVTI